MQTHIKTEESDPLPISKNQHNDISFENWEGTYMDGKQDNQDEANSSSISEVGKHQFQLHPDVIKNIENRVRSITVTSCTPKSSQTQSTHQNVSPSCRENNPKNTNHQYCKNLKYPNSSNKQDLNLAIENSKLKLKIKTMQQNMHKTAFQNTKNIQNAQLKANKKIKQYQAMVIVREKEQKVRHDKQIEGIRESHQQKVRQLQKSKEQEIKQLNSKLKRQSERVRQLEKNCVQMQSKEKVLKKKINELESELSECIKNLKIKEKQNKKFQQTLSQRDKQFESKIQQMQHNYDEIDTQLIHKNNQILQLKQQLLDQKEQVYHNISNLQNEQTAIRQEIQAQLSHFSTTIDESVWMLEGFFQVIGDFFQEKQQSELRKKIKKDIEVQEIEQRYLSNNKNQQRVTNTSSHRQSPQQSFKFYSKNGGQSQEKDIKEKRNKNTEKLKQMIENLVKNTKKMILVKSEKDKNGDKDGKTVEIQKLKQKYRKQISDLCEKLQFLVEQNTFLKKQIQLSFKDQSQILDRSRKQMLEKSLANTNEETKAIRQQIKELRGQRRCRGVEISEMMNTEKQLRMLEEKRQLRRQTISYEKSERSISRRHSNWQNQVFNSINIRSRSRSPEQKKTEEMKERIKIKHEVDKAKQVYERTSLKGNDRSIMNSSDREMVRGKSVPNLGQRNMPNLGQRNMPNLGQRNSKDMISWKMPSSKLLGVLPY